MRLVIQRCKNAKCIVNNEIISSIDKGFMILLGFCKEDETLTDYSYFINKITNLRIFSDENDKLNLSIKDIKGEILLISQFTLYADIKKGNRPSFTDSLDFEKAKTKYLEFYEELNKEISTKLGIFGADMKIDFTNDGPVTIIIDSREILK